MDFSNLLKLFFIPSLISFSLCYLLTPIIIRLAKSIKIIDYPGQRGDPATIHTKPVPRGGGIPLFLGIFLTSVFFLPLDQKLLAITLGAAILVLVGFLDDRKNTNPYLRLAAQILAAGVVVFSGVGITFVSNPLSSNIINFSNQEIFPQVLPQLLSIFWIVLLTNAVSWSSGVDGQLSGFTAIAALVIAILSFKYSADITQWPVTILAATTFGAFFGFLPWHIYPQKIMPGFGGGTLAGFMLAILSILTTAKVGTLLVVLAIPIADTFFTITRRIISGKSPVWGDKKHLHHRLLDAGWSKRSVALFYWGATGFLGILALSLNSTAKFYTIIGVSLFVGGVILWLKSFWPLSKRQDPDSG